MSERKTIEHTIAEFQVQDGGPEAVHISGIVTHIFPNGMVVSGLNRFRLLRTEYERAETISMRCLVCGQHVNIPNFRSVVVGEMVNLGLHDQD